MQHSTPPNEDEQRLFLVSNRLPITIKQTTHGDYELKKSSGGLVSGIAGLIKTKQFFWYGWPGMQLPADKIGPISDRLREEHSAFPIFIDSYLADKHYNGLSSKMTARIGPCLLLTLAR